MWYALGFNMELWQDYIVFFKVDKEKRMKERLIENRHVSPNPSYSLHVATFCDGILLKQVTIYDIRKSSRWK